MKTPWSVSFVHARAWTILFAVAAAGGAAGASSATPPAGVSASSAPASDARDDDRIAQWREDLRTLARELPARHKNAFHSITREQFDAAVAAIDARLNQSPSDTMIALEFATLVAKLGDSHTQIHLDVAAQKFHVYPIILRVFKDGVFVVGAANEHTEWLGARIDAIDGKPTDEVIERVGTIFAAENDSSRMNAVCNWMVLGEALQSTGISAQAERAAFTITPSTVAGSDHAGLKTVALDALPPGSKRPFTWKPDPKTPNPPLIWQRRKESYWFEPLEDHEALYVRYDRCGDDPDRTVAQFCEDSLKHIDEHAPRKVIIDLRRNSGGNSALLQPLIAGLAKRPDINAADRLLVLIGRSTFSSAMMNAQQLRDQTNATLIGEPTGGKPNHFGEIRTFDLPHSKLKVQYSTKLFKMVEGDPPAVMPDVLVEVTSAEYFATRDPVMETALDPAVGKTAPQVH